MITSTMITHSAKHIFAMSVDDYTLVNNIVKSHLLYQATLSISLFLFCYALLRAIAYLAHKYTTLAYNYMA